MDKGSLPTTDNPVLHSQMNVIIDKILDRPLKQVPLRAIATDDGEKLLEVNPIAQLKEQFIDVKKLKQLIVKKAKFPKECEVTDIEGQDIVDEMDVVIEPITTRTSRGMLVQIQQLKFVRPDDAFHLNVRYLQHFTKLGIDFPPSAGNDYRMMLHVGGAGEKLHVVLEHYLVPPSPS